MPILSCKLIDPVVVQMLHRSILDVTTNCLHNDVLSDCFPVSLLSPPPLFYPGALTIV